MAGPTPASPSAWYDPSVVAGTTVTSGAVSSLNDLSGNARHVAQSSSSARPTLSTTPFPLGIASLVFDGTDDWMGTTGGAGSPDFGDLLGASDYLVACAFVPGSVATNDVNPSLNDAVWSSYGGYSALYIRQSGADVAVNTYVHDGAYRYPASGGFVVTAGEPTVALVSHTGSTGRLRVLTLDSDNEVTFTAGAASYGVGGGVTLEFGRPSSVALYADIDVGEVLFYSADPGEEGRAEVARYLSGKWLRPRWDTSRAAMSY